MKLSLFIVMVVSLFNVQKVKSVPSAVEIYFMDKIELTKSSCADKYSFCFQFKDKCKTLELKKICRKTCGFCISEPQNKPYHGACGVPHTPLKYKTKFIIGGDTAAVASIPWQAALFKDFRDPWMTWNQFEKRSPQCGAVLIGNRHVVTAAHCFDEKRFNLHAKDWFVYLGKHTTRINTKDFGSQKVSIRKITIHPKYDFSTADNDIAVLRLNRVVDFDTFVRPVCLPTEDVPFFPGKIVLVSGFGVSNFETKSIEEKLQKVTVHVIEKSKCLSWLKKHDKNVVLTENMFCAGKPSGNEDSCQGDSGGPLVTEKDGQQFLLGIVSWGFNCGKAQKPGVYTKVSNYLEWIKKETK